LAVHPQLLEKLQQCKAASAATDGELLIAWPYAYRCLTDHHTRWQTNAGLEATRIFPPQAWRRLHADQIAASGYETARQMASAALCHSSPQITESSYVAVRDAAILSLANLFD